MQNKWLWGCGIGCGVLVLLVGLVAIGLAGLGLKYKDKALPGLLDMFDSNFEQLKKEGKVKPELQEPIAETIALLRRPETPLFAGMTVGGTLAETVEATSNDTADPKQALAMITDLRDLLKAKPAPTMEELNDVLNKHKDFMKSLDKSDSKIKIRVTK